MAFDLDLSDLIPNKLTVRAGDNTYSIRSELTPAMRVRVSRWWATYSAAFEAGVPVGGNKEIDDTLWGIVKDILGCPTVEEASLLGSAAAIKLLNFLQNEQDERNKGIAPTTTLSEPPSDLPSTTTEE